MKGVSIKGNYAEVKILDLGLERWPILQVEGLELSKVMEACKYKIYFRNSKQSDVKQIFSSFFETFLNICFPTKLT